MIKEFIILIKKYNEYLAKKIDESNKYNDIQIIIDKIVNNEKLSEDELGTFDSSIVKIFDKLDDNDKNRIPFFTFLLKNNKQLDDSQIELFYKIKKLIKPNNLDEFNQKLEKNNSLIEKLSSDKHFDNFEELIFAFDELEASNLDGISLSAKDKYNIINELIKRNYNATMVKENELEEDELPDEKIIRVNNEDSIKALLGKYHYDYDKLDKQNKEYLLKHLDIAKAEIILKLLEENNAHFNIKSINHKFMFCKILVNSTEEIINRVKETCDKYEIDFNKYIEAELRILVPNKPRKTKYAVSSENNSKGELTGGYGNYEKNISFLESGGYNVKNIMERCKAALTFNPYTLRRNLHIIENEYGISFKDGMAFTGVLSGDAINNIDRFIETSEYGLEYVQTNNSVTANASPKLFYAIIAAQMEKIDNLFYRNTKGDLNKYSIANKSKDTTDPRYLLLTRTSEELKAEVNPVEFTLEEDISQGLYELMANSIIDSNEDVSNNNYIKFLDKHYKVNDFVYVINGTRISRKKVLRICKNFIANNIEIKKDEIRFALAYNSILTKKDLENINNFRYATAYTLSNGGKKING